MTESNAATIPPAPEEVSRQDPGFDHDYWYGLIDEKAAARFRDVTVRKMQADRQRGDGAPYIRLSARCVKYTRAMLKADADARVRKSTADPGQEAA